MDRLELAGHRPRLHGHQKAELQGSLTTVIPAKAGIPGQACADLSLRPRPAPGRRSGFAVLLPRPEQLGGRNVDPFEAAVDPVEMRSDEVADLGAELID